MRTMMATIILKWQMVVQFWKFLKVVLPLYLPHPNPLFLTKYYSFLIFKKIFFQFTIFVKIITLSLSFMPLFSLWMTTLGASYIGDHFVTTFTIFHCRLLVFSRKLFLVFESLPLCGIDALAIPLFLLLIRQFPFPLPIIRALFVLTVQWPKAMLCLFTIPMFLFWNH